MQYSFSAELALRQRQDPSCSAAGTSSMLVALRDTLRGDVVSRPLILPWNHKNIQCRLPCYIDDLHNKLAALSVQLAGQDIPKSPKGWVTLSTLCKYTGPDVQGNVDARSQKIVATRRLLCCLWPQGKTAACCF